MKRGCGVEYDMVHCQEWGSIRGERHRNISNWVGAQTRKKSDGRSCCEGGPKGTVEGTKKGRRRTNCP